MAKLTKTRKPRTRGKRQPENEALSAACTPDTDTTLAVLTRIGNQLDVLTRSQRQLQAAGLRSGAVVAAAVALIRARMGL